MGINSVVASLKERGGGEVRVTDRRGPSAQTSPVRGMLTWLRVLCRLTLTIAVCERMISNYSELKAIPLMTSLTVYLHPFISGVKS